MARSLVLKVTAGKEDPERSNQALTVAAAAVASGVQVSLWLTGEASWFALPDGCPDLSLPHAAALPDLFAAVLSGGTVTLVHAVRRPAGHHRGRRSRRRADRRSSHVRGRDPGRRRAGPGLLTGLADGPTIQATRAR